MPDDTHDPDTPPVRQSTAPSAAGSDDWVPPLPSPLAGRTPAPTPPRDELPEHAGRFQIAGEIARGGMGAVLKAYDPELDRDLAVKILLAGLATHPTAARRFLDEARVAGRLQHPGLVPVHDLGTLPDGRPFFAMKLVEGRTLAALLRERHDRPRLVAIFEQVCEILTGHPPFGGASAVAVHDSAVRADTSAARVRLAGCGADPELVNLCERCLSADAADRPADAGEVAAAVAGLRAAAEERAWRAELERAAAEAQADEQRRKRRWQLAVAACVILLVTGGGAFAWYSDRQAADRRAEEARLSGERDAERRLKAEQARTGVAAALELATGLRRQYRFAEARDALHQAAGLAEGGGSDLVDQVRAATADLEFVVALDDIRYRKFVFGEGGRVREAAAAKAPPAYRAAFLARGYDLTAGDPAALAARVAASPVRDELVGALDDWAMFEPVFVLRSRVREVARRADLGPWTDRLRDDATLLNLTVSERFAARALVGRLAAEFDPARTSAASAAVLGAVMGHHGLNPVGVLSAARLRHPGNFELAFLLGLHERTKPGRLAACDAARTIRPTSAAALNQLGTALLWVGDKAGALAVLDEAVRLDPEHAATHNNRGYALRVAGRREEAVAEYREAIRLDPDDPVPHNNLGAALAAGGELDAAEREYTEAIRLFPEFANAHNNLGTVWRTRGKRAKARAEFEEAIRLDPTLAKAHNNLGVELNAAGDRPGAIAAYEEAVRLDPDDAQAVANLGSMFFTSDPATALGLLTRAVELDPDYEPARTGLALVLVVQKRYDDAVAHARAAVKADPKSVAARDILALALKLGEKGPPRPVLPTAPPRPGM